MTGRWRRLGGLTAVDGDRPMLGCLVMLGLAAATVAAAVGLVAGLWYSGYSVWDWCCNRATVRVARADTFGGQAVLFYEPDTKPSPLARVDAGVPFPVGRGNFAPSHDVQPVGAQVMKDRAVAVLMPGVPGHDSVELHGGRYTYCLMNEWPFEGWTRACDTRMLRGDVALFEPRAPVVVDELG